MMPSDEERIHWLTLPKIFFMMELAALTIVIVFVGAWLWKALKIGSADPFLQGAIVGALFLVFSIVAYREAKKRW